jgi:hypothetical protein
MSHEGSPAPGVEKSYPRLRRRLYVRRALLIEGVVDRGVW